ncbi:cell wall surface anchor family protein [Streptococcus pneumoniae GA13224]|nr:cell wall surface anchor family protein [Streptococcus pneumoniae GA13224]
MRQPQQAPAPQLPHQRVRQLQRQRVRLSQHQRVRLSQHQRVRQPQQAHQLLNLHQPVPQPQHRQALQLQRRQVRLSQHRQALQQVHQFQIQQTIRTHKLEMLLDRQVNPKKNCLIQVLSRQLDLCYLEF